MKTISTCLFAVLLNLSTNAQTAIPPSGSGTGADPYLIANLGNLYWVSQNPSAWGSNTPVNYKQVADIDASSTATWNGGEGFSPIGQEESSPVVINQGFNGNYNGNGYKITGLTINRTSGSLLRSEVGLFGSIVGGQISNVNIVNANITVSGSAPTRSVGILTGKNRGSLQDNTVSGTVNISACTNLNMSAGGLAGLLGDGAVMRCSANVTVTGNANNSYTGGLSGMFGIATFLNACWATGTVSGGAAVGGLVGYCNGTGANGINNCYASCTVSGGTNMGGLVGQISNGKIINCYSFGAVNGPASPTTGGLVGLASSATATASFWDQQTSGQSTSALGAPKLPADLKNINTFTSAGWDFICEVPNGLSDFWAIRADTNNAYPYLKWYGGPYSDNCRIWYGTADTVWSNAANWSFGKIPQTGDCILLHASATRNLGLDNNYSQDAVYFGYGSVNVVLGNYDLRLLYTLNHKVNAYVQTNGTGKLTIPVSIGNPADIGVGNQTRNSVFINNATGVDDDFSIRVLDEVYEDGLTGAVKNVLRVKRTWDIGKGSGTANLGSGVIIRFDFQDNAMIAGTIVGANKPKFYHYTGGTWINEPLINGSFTLYPAMMSGGGYFNAIGYKGTFSPFSIMLPTQVLPLTWGSFSVTPSGKTARLNWSTFTEQHTRSFIIQRSPDGAAWQDIGEVGAAGNSSQVRGYQFTDLHLLNGRNFYRLKQTDLDENYTYSNIELLDLTQKLKQLSISPNPVLNGILSVQLPETQVVEIYNAAGVRVFRQKLAGGNQQIPVSNLPAGCYFLKAGKETAPVIIP